MSIVSRFMYYVACHLSKWVQFYARKGEPANWALCGFVALGALKAAVKSLWAWALAGSAFVREFAPKALRVGRSDSSPGTGETYPEPFELGEPRDPFSPTGGHIRLMGCQIGLVFRILVVAHIEYLSWEIPAGIAQVVEAVLMFCIAATTVPTY